jgi:hypothetical protein
VRSHGRQQGWSVDSLVSVLRIEDDESQLAECWTILADQPLDEVLVELDVDPPQGVRTLPDLLACGATIDVTYGGELVWETWPASERGRPVVAVRLPGPLEPLQNHEFRLTLSVPVTTALRRHVHVPGVPCRELTVRVRFAGAGGHSRGCPPSAWLVESASLHELDRGARQPRSLPLLALDTVGEVGSVFRSPTPGLAYGIHWSSPR